MNRIVFELCAEDRARLDDIIAGLAKVAAAAAAEAAPLIGEATAMLAAAAEHPADAPTTHLEPPAPAPEVKPVPLGEFQKAIVTRCAESPAMKAKVQALVHKYAPSVSEIPEDKRPEVLAALKNL